MACVSSSTHRTRCVSFRPSLARDGRPAHARRSSSPRCPRLTMIFLFAWVPSNAARWRGGTRRFKRSSTCIHSRPAWIVPRSCAVSRSASTALPAVRAVLTPISPKTMCATCGAAFDCASTAPMPATQPDASRHAKPRRISASFARWSRPVRLLVSPVPRSASYTPLTTSTAGSAPKSVAAASRHATTCSQPSASRQECPVSRRRIPSSGNLPESSRLLLF